MSYGLIENILTTWKTRILWPSVLVFIALGFSKQFLNIETSFMQFNVRKKFESTGKYVTREVYHMMRERKPKVQWRKIFYGNLARPIAKFILWMILLDGLPTKNRLHRFEILANNKYVLWLIAKNSPLLSPERVWTLSNKKVILWLTYCIRQRVGTHNCFEVARWWVEKIEKDYHELCVSWDHLCNLNNSQEDYFLEQT